ncbi:MAG: MerR family transcriptional regulator [Anaerolineales bacterium]|nr:MerR family transcriptional regulator [Anaerolineales bacterium]
MTGINKIPTYNLKVVVQETGIKPDTLRAWERRYGLPTPERTAGGHRLYSQYDIETLKWLLARQDEGLSISRAVELWETLRKDGQDPLIAMPSSIQDSSREFAGVVSGATLDELREHWIDAVMAFDEPIAENILTQAFARYPVETVCIELLQKGLSQVGMMWYGGGASVQQEHFASALAIRRLDALIAATPNPTRRARVLVGTPPGEEHTFSALVVTLLLRQRGWPVVYLGANVPLDRLKSTIEKVNPELVVFIAMQLDTAASLLDVARFLQAEDVPLAFGGLIFNQTPYLVDRIPGYYLGERLEHAAEIAEKILTINPPMSGGMSPSKAYKVARENFLNAQPHIEATLWQELQDTGMNYQDILIATNHLSNDIVAALSLGDMNYVQPEIEWLEGFGKNYHIPPAALKGYFEAYYQAASQHLDARGEPVIAWLDKVRQNFIN